MTKNSKNDFWTSLFTVNDFGRILTIGGLASVSVGLAIAAYDHVSAPTRPAHGSNALSKPATQQTPALH